MQYCNNFPICLNYGMAIEIGILDPPLKFNTKDHEYGSVADSCLQIVTTRTPDLLFTELDTGIIHSKAFVNPDDKNNVATYEIDVSARGTADKIVRTGFSFDGVSAEEQFSLDMDSQQYPLYTGGKDGSSICIHGILRCKDSGMAWYR